MYSIKKIVYITEEVIGVKPYVKSVEMRKHRPLAYDVTSSNSALTEVNEDLSMSESCAWHVHTFAFSLCDLGLCRGSVNHLGVRFEQCLVQ